LNSQTPYDIYLGDGFIISESSWGLSSDKEYKGLIRPDDRYWELCYLTHPDIGMAYTIVSDVWQYSMPDSGKVYGASGEGYYIASHYSIIDPGSSVELFQDENEWTARMASVAGLDDIEMVEPDRKQASGYWTSRYAIMSTSIAGIAAIVLIRRGGTDRS
jgi:hypothetical protein